MAFNFRRVRLGERLAALCAVLLFIDLFLHWYSAGPFAVNAWDAFGFIDVLLVLLVLVTLALVFLSATQRTPALPIAASVIVTAFGALMTLIVLYRIINSPGPNDLVNVEYGAYLGLLLTLGTTLGGYMAMRDEGTTLAGARAQAETLMGDRGTRVTPPAAGADPAVDRPAGTPVDAPAADPVPPPTADPVAPPPPSDRPPGAVS